LLYAPNLLLIAPQSKIVSYVTDVLLDWAIAMSCAGDTLPSMSQNRAATFVLRIPEEKNSLDIPPDCFSDSEE
jgi:hypothetical protein